MGVSPSQAMETEAKLRAAMLSRFQPLMMARVAGVCVYVCVHVSPICV